MSATIHIAGNLKNPKVVSNYYVHSPQEHFGGDFFNTGSGKAHIFRDFIHLAEQIAKYKSENHIIVTHGWADIPPADMTSATATAGVSMKFSGSTGMPMFGNFKDLMQEVAEYRKALVERGSPPSVNASDYGIGGLTNKAIIAAATASAKITHNPRLIVRGCQIGRVSTACMAFGRALGASGIDAPTRDQLYAAFEVKKMSSSDIRSKESDSLPMLTRRRSFWQTATAPGNAPVDNKFVAGIQQKLTDTGDLLLEVFHDGEKVTPKAWGTLPEKGVAWGDALNRMWRAATKGNAAHRFGTKILWQDDSLGSMVFPADIEYLKLHFTAASL